MSSFFKLSGKLIVAFIAIFCLEGKSQVVYEAHFLALTSQLSGDGYTGFKKLGFSGGLGSLHALKKEGHFVAFELNYIQKGVRDRRNEDVGDFNEFSLKANYLELPMSYLFPAWGVYVQGGISAAYNLKFEQATNGIMSPEITDQRAIELGFHLGVNFQISDQLLLNVQYMNSLTPVQKSNVPYSFWFQQAGMHSLFGIKLQYFFNAPSFVWKKSKSQEIIISVD
ncbi:MAG: hypothetical protein ACJA0Q_002071 [Saprospiraceae bacterium]|jgi:hypothetical protein